MPAEQIKFTFRKKIFLYNYGSNNFKIKTRYIRINKTSWKNSDFGSGSKFVFLIRIQPNTWIRICNSATDCTADSHKMVPWSPKEGKSAKLYCTKYDEKIPIVHTKVPVLDGITSSRTRRYLFCQVDALHVIKCLNEIELPGI